MKTQLPPGPRAPSVLQALGAWSRPIAVLERSRRRYGKRYTVRLAGQPPFVMLSDPQDIKEVLTAPPDVLHPGEGAKVLEVLLGANSVILLDEAPHLEQRKLLLPAFHGERMQSLAGLIRELCDQEIESWPREQPIELHGRLQQLTLEIMLRAVFGLQRGARLDGLRDLLTSILRFTEHPLSLLRPPSKRIEDLLALRGPLARTRARMTQADELIYELIDERRREGADGVDILSLLLGATHEDGSPMSPVELRDELMTALVAGHETTASQLAWAFADLARAPRVRARLTHELDAGDDEDYLNATINEIMRHRPVLPNAEPRLVKQPIAIGGFDYPPGVVLFVNAHLVHHDPEIYPEPNAFRPERFLESEGGSSPGTYTWLPFGGGRRRCLGASFAQLEMRIVLRAVFERCDVQPDGGRPEVARRRSITVSPSRGANVILRQRSRAPQDAREEEKKLAVAAPDVPVAA